MDWSRISAIRTVLLVLAGFTLLALAAFTFNRIAGFAVTGAEVLVFAYLTDTGQGEQARR